MEITVTWSASLAGTETCGGLSAPPDRTWSVTGMRAFDESAFSFFEVVVAVLLVRLVELELVAAWLAVVVDEVE